MTPMINDWSEVRFPMIPHANQNYFIPEVEQIYYDMLLANIRIIERQSEELQRQANEILAEFEKRGK